MSWDKIEGQWKQRRGKAVHHWGEVMNDDLAAIAGKYEELVGKLQEKYGIAREEANVRVDEYKKTVDHLKKSNARLMKLQKSLHSKGNLSKKRVRSKNQAENTLRPKSGSLINS